MCQDPDTFLFTNACIMAILFLFGLLSGSMDLGHLLLMIAIIGGMAWFFSAFKED